MLSILIVAVALVSVASTVYFWLRARRLRREATEWATLAELNHDTNYKLACELHGKDAVDRAIREAHARGGN